MNKKVLKMKKTAQKGCFCLMMSFVVLYQIF